MDVVGNEFISDPITFTIDSRDPRIYRTEPRRGFADGDFEVQFKEDNPEELVLHYGVSEDMRQEVLDIEDDCSLERGKYFCDVSVQLGDYDGQEIEYYFTLTDIAGNTDESKVNKLNVDTTFPVINNDPIFTQGEGRYERYIYLDINVTEENLDEVFYSYIDDRDRLRERRLCSRLKDGVCEKRVVFRNGHYDLTISVIDEAGNSLGIPISFDVDY